MSVNSLAEDVVSQIKNNLSSPLTESEILALSEIIDKALVAAVNQSTERYTQAVTRCCGPEADLAHKIAHEVDLTQKALIANLNSLR